MIREKELCTLGKKVSYKSHSGIIRAGSRYFCSLGKERGELGGGAPPRLSQNLPSRAGLTLNARGRVMSAAFGASGFSWD